MRLGVFGSNPLEQIQSQRVKPEYLYLYMGLAGLYIYAIVTPDVYQRVIFIESFDRRIVDFKIEYEIGGNIKPDR